MADSSGGDFAALSPQQQRRRLGELAWVFFRLGATAFGGPAAHVALMNQEIVERRRWLSQEELLDLMGLANLIPGPNSTELAIHIGYARGREWGLWIAGACFILPAMVLVWILAALYTQYQSLPQVEGFLYGVKPVIIAVILQALWKLGQKALKNRLTWGAALAAFIGYLLGWPEIALLVTLGAGVMLLSQGGKNWDNLGFLIPLPLVLTQPPGNPTIGAGSVFLFFLKIGAVLYGSGYVLLAFLQRELVEQNQWLTPQQLLDAVAIGQFTPGPVFTTATFVGYLLAGNAGAVAATVGIFLPAFVLVRLTHPWASRLRQSPWLSGFLDGVNGASLGLMAGVSLTLVQTTWVDPLTVLLTVATGLLLWRWRVNSAWLVIVGGLIGLATAGLF